MLFSRPNQALQRTARRSDASPPRNSSHEALPFVEAAAKAKLAGSVETQPCAQLARFPY